MASPLFGAQTDSKNYQLAQLLAQPGPQARTVGEGAFNGLNKLAAALMQKSLDNKDKDTEMKALGELQRAGRVASGFKNPDTGEQLIPGQGREGMIAALLASENPQAAQLGLEMQTKALSTEAPSAVREYEYYKKLPNPEAQKEFIDIKRAQQWLNAGGMFINPATNQQITKTLAPEDLPENVRTKAEAGAEGKAAGEAVAAGEKKSKQAGDVLGLIKEARTLLPQASSGSVEKGAAKVANFFGVSTPGSAANAQLKVISAGLTSNIPRMEGPQSNLDAALYRQAAADVDNPDTPYEDRLAALDTMETLWSKYGGQNQGGEPMNQAATNKGGWSIKRLP